MRPTLVQVNARLWEMRASAGGEALATGRTKELCIENWVKITDKDVYKSRQATTFWPVDNEGNIIETLLAEESFAEVSNIQNGFIDLSHGPDFTSVNGKNIISESWERHRRKK